MDARFKPGDSVRIRVDDPPRHIRTPAYIQGKIGRVETVQGAFYDPESLAYGGEGLPKQFLYLVRFDERSVWVRYGGDPQDQLLIDIYEHWLEPV